MLDVKKRSLFHGRLLADLPESYQAMDTAMADKLFPYEKKPQIILGDTAESRLCTFSLLKELGLSKNQVEEAIYSISKIIQSLYPAGLLDNPKLLRQEKNICGWFAFQTAQKDGKWYNIMYVISVDGCMMLGTMACSMDDADGKQDMIEIMKSLEIPEVESSYTIAKKRLIP